MASTMDEIRCAVTAIKDKKGEHVRVLDVRAKSSITDYMVLATGTSDPHLKAMRMDLKKALDAIGVSLSGDDGDIGSGWVVIDAFDFVVHLQTNEMRDFYQLEQLWKDAGTVEV